MQGVAEVAGGPDPLPLAVIGCPRCGGVAFPRAGDGAAQGFLCTVLDESCVAGELDLLGRIRGRPAGVIAVMSLWPRPMATSPAR